MRTYVVKCIVCNEPIMAPKAVDGDVCSCECAERHDANCDGMGCTGCDGDIVCIKIVSWNPDDPTDKVTEYYCSNRCMLKWWGD